MTLFDEQAYQRKFSGPTYDDKVKAAYRSKRNFYLVRPSKMDDGAYMMRILPPMLERCPDVPMAVLSHSVQVNPGNDTIQVECLAPDPCALCEIVRDLAEAVAGRRLPKEIISILAGDPQKNAKKHKDDPKEFNLAVWMRMAFPITIFAKPKNPDERNSIWERSSEEVVAIFEFSVKDPDSGLAKDIKNILRGDPYVTHVQRGRYLKFTRKSNSYGLSVMEKAEPIKTAELVTSKSYPNLERQYFGGDYGIKRKSYEEQQDLIDSCWWVRDPNVKRELEAAIEREEGDQRLGQSMFQSPEPAGATGDDFWNDIPF